MMKKLRSGEERKGISELSQIDEQIEEKIKQIAKEVEEINHNMEQYSLLKAIEIGNKLIIAQNLLFPDGKNKRRNWGPYLKEYFPFLHPRKAQRYMQLAANVDIETFPALAAICQDQHLKLIHLAKGDKPEELLLTNKINLEDEIVKPNEIKNLRINVNDIISKKEEEIKEKKSKSNNNVNGAATLKQKSNKDKSTQKNKVFSKLISDITKLIDSNKEVNIIKRKIKKSMRLKARLTKLMILLNNLIDKEAEQLNDIMTPNILEENEN